MREHQVLDSVGNWGCVVTGARSSSVLSSALYGFVGLETKLTGSNSVLPFKTWNKGSWFAELKTEEKCTASELSGI
jgi:hypothetical protein